MYKTQKDDLKFALQTGITGQISVYRFSHAKRVGTEEKGFVEQHLFENQHLILSDGKSVIHQLTKDNP